MYRRQKLREWSKRREKEEKSESERARTQILYSDFTAVPAAEERATAYTLNYGEIQVPLVGAFPPMRWTYVVGENGAVQREHTEILAPFKGFGGAVIIETSTTTTEYVSVDAAVAPFVSRRHEVSRYRQFGVIGEVEILTEYSDYRRVKCFDDRFEVRIGDMRTKDIISPP